MKNDSPYNELLQELLRRHLLDPENGKADETILNRITEKAMQSDPAVVMSEAKKAEMLSRLKNHLPPPGPAGGSSIPGWIMPSVAGVIVLSVAAFLFLKTPSQAKNEIKSYTSQSSVIPGTDPAVQPSVSDAEKASLPPVDFVVKPAQHNAPPANSNPLANITGPAKPPVNVLNSAPTRNDLSVPPVSSSYNLSEMMLLTAGKPVVKKMIPQHELSFIAPGGTLFYFPANCFADEFGNPVADEITIRITECNSKMQAVRNHMSTNAENDYLQSGGMFNIEALAGGKKLKLASGMSYYVEFPSVHGNNMYLYDGFRDSEGSMSWRMSKKQDRIMIPLPVAEINFLQFLSPVKGKKEWDNLIHMLNGKGYEGTFIATREFVQRLAVARRMGFASEILQIYMDNVQLNLDEVDEMVAYNLRGSYKNYEFKSPGELSEEDFENFLSLHLKKPVRFNPRGVDLSQPDARQKLQEAGASIDEIESTLLVYNTRASILAEINGPIEAVTKKKLNNDEQDFVMYKGLKEPIVVWGSMGVSWSPKSRSTGFRVSRMGGVNLDCPVAAPMRNDLVVQLPPDFSKQNCKLYFMPAGSFMSVAESKPDKNAKASFANLPFSSGKVVCMGTHMGTPWYAEQNVNLSGDAQVFLNPEQLSSEQFLEKVEKLGNW